MTVNVIKLYADPSGNIVDVNGKRDDEPKYIRLHGVEINDDSCTVVVVLSDDE